MIKIKHIGVSKGQFFLIVVFVKAVLNLKNSYFRIVCMPKRERKMITAHALGRG
jgi:hypothetical protein